MLRIGVLRSAMAACAGVLLLSSCVSRPMIMDQVGVLELGRTQLDDGRTEIYRLGGWSEEGRLELVVETETPREKAHLGLDLKEFETDIGEGLVRRGLVVNRVTWESPAEAAGVAAGDVVTAVNGTEVFYRRQVEALLVDKIKPGSEISLAVTRREGEASRSLDLRLRSSTLSYTETTQESVALARPSYGGRSFAGIVVGEVPADWSRRIYGADDASVVIGRVVTGSPAYLSGLRLGDRIIKLDGQPVHHVDDFANEIATLGERGEKVLFEVSRANHTYETEVQLSDYSRRVTFGIPFLMKYRGSCETTEWSVGPFGLIFDYDGRYLPDSRSREPSYHREFQMALNLFEREWWPTGHRTELLWLIELESR